MTSKDREENKCTDKMLEKPSPWGYNVVTM